MSIRVGPVVMDELCRPVPVKPILKQDPKDEIYDTVSNKMAFKPV
jgi:hypothetical protein